MNLQDALSYIAQRMTEPSTWVSIGALVTAVGWNIAPEYWTQIAAIGMGVGGLMGTILRERQNHTTPEIKAIVKETVKDSAVKDDEK
jgi:hypothetical protein